MVISKTSFANGRMPSITIRRSTAKRTVRNEHVFLCGDGRWGGGGSKMLPRIRRGVEAQAKSSVVSHIQFQVRGRQMTKHE